MQEVRKSQNQDLRVDPAWNINSGQIESSPGDFPGLSCLRAETSSSGRKDSEILCTSGVETFYRSDSCLLSLVDVRSPVLCAPFFTSCEAIEFAVTGHRREESPDVPVSLLMALKVLQLECEKSMELTVSFHRSWFFCSSQKSRDEAALSEWGSDKGTIEVLAFFGSWVIIGSISAAAPCAMHVLTQSTLKTTSAGSSGCSRSDRFVSAVKRPEGKSHWLFNKDLICVDLQPR